MSTRADINIRARNVGIDPTNYANDSKLEQRVIFEEKAVGTASGTAASGTLTTTGVFSNNETVTIGSRVYTMKTTLTGAADEVLIGGSAAISLDNIKLAVNAGATAGTEYGLGTAAHELVTATTNAATTQLFVSIEEGLGANTIETTETATNASFGATTLAGGVAGTAAVGSDNQALHGGARV